MQHICFVELRNESDTVHRREKFVFCKAKRFSQYVVKFSIKLFGEVCFTGERKNFHVPGSVNVLVDILSKAVSKNINCRLPKEHELSKQWAAVIPPINNNFKVD